MFLPTDHYKIVEVYRGHGTSLPVFNSKVLSKIEEMNAAVRHPGHEEWRIVSMTINYDGTTFAGSDKVYSFVMQMYEG